MRSEGQGVVFTTYDDAAEVVIQIDRPRLQVFLSVFEVDVVAQWMRQRPDWILSRFELDMHTGGHFCFVWLTERGKRIETSGEFTEVVLPERVVTRTIWHPNQVKTVNTSVFSEVNGQTILGLTVRYQSAAELAVALVEGAEQSLIRSFGVLRQILSPA